MINPQGHKLTLAGNIGEKWVDIFQNLIIMVVVLSNKIDLGN